MSHRRVSSLALAMALLATACTGDSLPAERDEVPSGPLVLWDITRGEKQARAMQDIVERFEQVNPGLQVDYRLTESDLLPSELATAVREGRAPDVVRVDTFDLPELVAQGALSSLPEGIASAADYVDVAWEAGQLPTVDAKEVGDASPTQASGRIALHGLPLSAEAPMLLVRDAANVGGDVERGAPSTDTQYWDSWESVSEAARGREGPILAGAVDSWTLLPFVYGEGGRMLDTTTSEVLIAREDAINGVSLAADLIDAGILLRPEVEDPAKKAVAAFVGGTVSAMLATVEDLEAVTADSPTPIILPMPSGSSGQRGSPYRGSHMAVTSHSDSQESAIDLAAYVSSTQAQVALAAAGMFPTREEAYADPDTMENRRLWQYRAVLDSVVPAPGVENEAALYPILYSGWRNVVDGILSAEEGTLEVAQQWLEVLPGGYSITLR